MESERSCKEILLLNYSALPPTVVKVFFLDQPKMIYPAHAHKISADIHELFSQSCSFRSLLKFLYQISLEIIRLKSYCFKMLFQHNKVMQSSVSKKLRFLYNLLSLRIHLWLAIIIPFQLKALLIIECEWGV